MKTVVAPVLEHTLFSKSFVYVLRDHVQNAFFEVFFQSWVKWDTDVLLKKSLY